MKKPMVISTFIAGVVAWTGIGAALAAGYLAYVFALVGVAAGIWIIGWAVGLWMRGWNR